MQLLGRCVELQRQIDQLRKQLEETKNEAIEIYINGCPKYSLPEDCTLNWRERSSVIWVATWGGEGSIEISKEHPHILNGSMNKRYKKGTELICLESWKTSKNTKGTHHVLYNPHTKMVANFYG